MLKRGNGSIVTISSVNSFLPDPAIIDYTAAKAALTNFCKALSKEVGPQGIRMNTVSPGPVETAAVARPARRRGDRREGVGRRRRHRAQSRSSSRRAASPPVRFTRPDEVADLALLLASDRAGNVTGSDFVIDGGLIKTL